MKVFRDQLRTVALVAVAQFSLTALAEAQPIDYHGNIAPLLRQYCAGCHNDDDFEGDFSVERFSDLEEGGSKGVMLRPGKPEESYLIKLLTSGTEEPMPPRDEPQPSESEIALLKRWITEGAKGPKTDADDISILSMLTVPSLPKAPGASAITAMERSSDGKHFAIARYGEVEIRQENAESRKLSDLPGKVNALHFSKDGKHLVVASGIAGLKGVASIWDVASGKLIRELGPGYHRDVLYDAEFSPDGKLLATAGYDRKIALWNLENGEQIRSIEVHNGAVFDLAFSPDGTVLASASGDATVKLWRVADGERLDTLNQPQGEQYSVTFSPDGEFIFAAGDDNRIRMYRFISLTTPKINPLIHARFAHESAVVKIVVSDDGKWLASSGDDRSVKLWTLPELVQIKAWEAQPDIAPALVFAGDRIISGRMDGSIEEGQVGDLTLSSDAGKTGPKSAAAPKAAKAATREVVKVTEEEKAEAIPVSLPAEISGAIQVEGDTDDFRFSARAGEIWILEVNAARVKSPLDSKVEVLGADGQPIEQVKLQAVRDSWFEFRGKDSSQVTDFRVFNWREMELNEYLYCNGEVVKLWLDPRGPDSGFTVYPGFGKRHNWFNTSGQTHALGEPCYVVRPIPAGQEPVPNGLPIYTLYYENDDDPQQRYGSDSVLTFTVPSDGDYVARIGDVRGFGGKDFSYQLNIRAPKPNFKLTHNIDTKKGLSLAPGSGKEVVFRVERHDGFDGEIEVNVVGLPEGFTASTPVVIQAGQHEAVGAIYVAADAPAASADALKAVKFAANAKIGGKKVVRDLALGGPLTVAAAPPKLLVEILPDGDSGDPVVEQGKPMELTIHPGETITAMVRANRIGFEGQVDFGKEDSGRNLAHGLIIDNIGLSGLMIPEKAGEQRFFITAAGWVPDSTRTFFLRTPSDGGHATRPIILHVKKREPAS